MWEEGEIEAQGITFRYYAKVFEVGSIFGINNGRISKLEVRDKATGKTVINYDRGWDIKPKTKSAKKVLELILEKYS